MLSRGLFIFAVTMSYGEVYSQCIGILKRSLCLIMPNTVHKFVLFVSRLIKCV